MSYLNWQNKTLENPTDADIEALYNDGYVFTRVGKGYFTQTRSLRIDLSQFELSSENRRILKKAENIKLEIHPLPYENYHWSIHKLAKDFYTDKFGKDTFSANKTKELLTNAEKSNFNTLLVYRTPVGARLLSCRSLAPTPTEPIGYCISLLTKNILHYSYPFYRQSKENPSIGLGMMTKAVCWAKEKDLKYIYLGSLQRPSDTYKLQFTGIEWFDGNVWQTDLQPLKQILKRCG